MSIILIKRPAIIVIDSATYLLTISSPEIEGDLKKGQCYVLEPGLEVLSGLSIPETVVTVGGTGRIFVLFVTQHLTIIVVL